MPNVQICFIRCNMENLFLLHVIKRLMVMLYVVKFDVVLSIKLITGLNILNICHNAPPFKARHFDF